MKEIRKTTQFKKDFKRISKDIKKVEALLEIVRMLAEGKVLPKENKPHPLGGDYNIPHFKSLKDYPAVLVARLGVSKDFRSLHIGSDVLSYIKLWFLEPYNKTGCRFMIVDAYNEPATMAFYEQNDFNRDR